MSDLKPEFSDIGSLVAYLRGLPENFIPPEADLRARLDKHLVVTGAMSQSREEAVLKVTKLIGGWLHRFGGPSTAGMVDLFFVKHPLITVRRLNHDGSDADRDIGGENQPTDVSATFGVVVRDQEQKREDGNDTGQQGLRLLEGGIGKGTVERNQAPEHTEGISRRLVLLELGEHEEDLRVFTKAYNGIRARVRTVEDEGRFMKLATWSGTTATLGLLELVIHNIERVVAELKDIINKIDNGTIPNLDEE